MGIVDFVLKRPITVAVGVFLLVLFGLIGLGAIPVQLVPDVDQPIVTISTPWAGRTPQEVVEEVTKEQEEQLGTHAVTQPTRSLQRESFFAAIRPGQGRQTLRSTGREDSGSWDESALTRGAFPRTSAPAS